MKYYFVEGIENYTSIKTCYNENYNRSEDFVIKKAKEFFITGKLEIRENIIDEHGVHVQPNILVCEW